MSALAYIMFAARLVIVVFDTRWGRSTGQGSAIR